MTSPQELIDGRNNTVNLALRAPVPVENLDRETEGIYNKHGRNRCMQHII